MKTPIPFILTIPLLIPLILISTSCSHNANQKIIDNNNDSKSSPSVDMGINKPITSNQSAQSTQSTQANQLNQASQFAQSAQANQTKKITSSSSKDKTDAKANDKTSDKTSDKADNKKSKGNHGLTKDFDTQTISQKDPKQTDNTANSTTSQSDWQWNLPKYFPIPKVPEDNPMTVAKVELGRFLFYDKRLSATGDTSCASCHLQHLAFTDGKPRSVGATGEVHPRSSLGLANVAYMPTLNWANPAVTSLEAQMLIPMFGDMPIELGLTDKNFPEVQATFAKDARYQRMFREAFANSASNPNNSVNSNANNNSNGNENADVKKQNEKTYTKAEDYSLVEISQAIASFERSLISADSKFDRYMQGKATLTDSEKRGKTLFFGEKAECHHCHGSFNFNDQVIHSKSRTVPIRFHNTGMYNLDEQGSYQENNEGLYDVTANIEDKGKFKAPSLRNIAVTAPYNHDGSTKTLEDVLANYARGGRIIHASNAEKNLNSVEQASHNSTSKNLPSLDKISDDGAGSASNPKSSLENNHIGDGRFNPNKSDLIVRIELTKEEQADIIAFLKTLTDETLLTDPKYSNPWTTQTNKIGEKDESNNTTIPTTSNE